MAKDAGESNAAGKAIKAGKDFKEAIKCYHIRSDVKEWLTRARIETKRRPESLSIEEFARLANTN